MPDILFIEKFLKECEFRKLSSHTIRAYKNDLYQFKHFIYKNNLSSVDVKPYIDFLSKQYDNTRTLKRKIASIKSLYSYLESEEIILSNPIKKIKFKFKNDKSLPRLISPRVISMILLQVYQNLNNSHTCFSKFISLRNVLIIEFLIRTGLRISELCSLMWQNIDFSTGTLFIKGKGNKERVVYIEDKNFMELLNYYKKNFMINSKYVFLNRYHQKLSEQAVRLILNDLKQKLHITQPVTPHMFRHTFATQLLENDVDIRYIQKILGHSSINVTQIYTHIQMNKEREIMKSKNPRLSYKSISSLNPSHTI